MLTLLIIFSYLMGSIPSGYIYVKKKMNLDIRQLGSGNIGATNVRRVAGTKAGKVVALSDMLKALVPVLLTKFLLWKDILHVNESIALGVVAIAAILGHNFTIFLKFKGGKGVATSAAAFMCIVPIPFLITFISFFALKIKTKIVSIRSLTAGVVLFLSTWILGYNKYLVISTLIVCLLVFYTHRSNIKRLIKGEEK